MAKEIKGLGIRAVKLRPLGFQQTNLKSTGNSPSGRAQAKVFYHEAVVPPKGGKKKEFSREVDKLVPTAPTGSSNVF